MKYWKVTSKKSSSLGEGRVRGEGKEGKGGKEEGREEGGKGERGEAVRQEN